MHLHIVSYQFPPSTAEVFEILGATILSKDMIRLPHLFKKKTCFISTLHSLYSRILVSGLIEIGTGSGEENYKSCHTFSLFCYYLPLENAVPIDLYNKNYILFTKGYFVPSLAKIGPL